MTSEALSFRTLGPEDHDAWREIRLEMLEAHPDAFLTTHAEELRTTEEARRAQLAGRRIIAALVGSDLVGVVALLPEKRVATAHRASIGAMYVRPGFRGRRLGLALIEEATRRARAIGAVQLELFVAEGNAAARAVYERAGFRAEGRLPRAVRTVDGFIDDVFYVRALDR